MAQGKKSFILYCDQRGIFEKLSNEQAGQLIKHIFAYVSDENPEGDFVTELAFESIKTALKRDLKKYEGYIDKQRENGKRGGRPKKPKKPKPFLENPTKPKKADSVSVSDNVNVSDNKDYRELRFREQVAQHTQYNSQMLEAFSDYWTESKPKGKKMKFEMQKTFDIERRLKTWNRNDFGTKEKETNTVTGSIRDLGLNPINRR